MNTTASAEYPLAARIPMAVLLILVIIVGIIGNGVICWTIYKDKDLRKVLNNWFILNMAFADIGVLLSCVYFPLRTYIKGKWDFSKAACKLSGFLNSALMLASILTLMMISLHQYFTVLFKWPERRLRRAAIIMITYVWLHATILSSLPLTAMSDYDLKPGRGQCAVKLPVKPAEKLTATIYMVTGFVIPLIIMSFSYYRIMKVVSKHARRISRMSNNASMDRKHMQRQVAVTMIIVLIVFLICWSPFLVMSLFGTFIPALSNPILANLAFSLGFANSCCNPLVLGTRNRAFKYEFLEIVDRVKAQFGGCCCKVNKEPTGRVTAESMAVSDISVVHSNAKAVDDSGVITI